MQGPSKLDQQFNLYQVLMVVDKTMKNKHDTWNKRRVIGNWVWKVA